jgi:hypothetical protein
MLGDTKWRFLCKAGLIEITNQRVHRIGRSILTIAAYNAFAEKHLRIEYCNIDGSGQSIHLSATS